MVKDERMRVIVNFKNNDLEKQLFEYVKNLELEGQSAYVKKLILDDLKKKGLIK